MRCFSLVLFVLLLLFQGCRPALADNPYGVMLWSNGEDPALLLARARGLGVAWYRPPPYSLISGRLTPPVRPVPPFSGLN